MKRPPRRRTSRTRTFAGWFLASAALLLVLVACTVMLADSADQEPTPTDTSTPTPTPSQSDPADEDGDDEDDRDNGDTTIYYDNCADARADGAAPLYAGDPGYRPGLDRDKDGDACE